MLPNSMGKRSHSVIVSETPVARWHLRRPARTVNAIVVYSTVDGTLESPGRPLTRMEELSGRYHTRYEVDSARQTARITEPLPCKDDRFMFTIDAVVGWRVVDGIPVIKDRLGDALESTVVGYVKSRMRAISRQYGIEHFTPVEAAINRLLASGPIELPNLGIIIDGINAHISHDRDTRKHLQDETDIDRRIALGRRSHALTMQEQRQAQALERERLDAVAAGVQGEFGLIAMFLRHHPDQSLQVLQMLHARQVELEQRQQAKLANSTAMFDKMLEHQLIQDIDIEPIRDALLSSLLTTVTGTSPAPQVTLNGVFSAPEPLSAPAQIARPTLGGAPSPGPEPTPSPDPPPADGEASASTPLSGVAGWRQRRRPQTPEARPDLDEQ